MPYKFVNPFVTLRTPVVLTLAVASTTVTPATSTVTISIPAGSGKVYVLGSYRSNSVLNSCDVGGTAGTVEVTATTTGPSPDIGSFIASYPLGTTGGSTSFDLNFSTNMTRMSYEVWRATGSFDDPQTTQTFNPSGFGTTATMSSLNITAGGAFLGCGNNIVQGTTYTWTGPTESADSNHTDYRFSTARLESAGGVSGASYTAVTVASDYFTAAGICIR